MSAVMTTLSAAVVRQPSPGGAADSILETMGNKPLVRLARLTFRALRTEGRGSVDPDSIRRLKLDELEERLVAVHVLQPRIHRLMEKYRG
jgi:hypothetical protein